MTLDELAVLRWASLSNRERQASEMGPPLAALQRVAGKLQSGAPLDKRIKERKEDIMRLAASPLS